MFTTNSHRRYLAVLTIMLCATSNSESLELTIPDSGRIQILKTLDGSVSFGQIVQVGEDSIVFKTRFGGVSIPVSDIRDIREAPPRSIRNGEYRYPNPNESRLLFAPTGRALRGGQGYVADHALFFPSVTMGLTDRITIGGGTSVIPGIDVTDQLFYITPKIALYSSESVSLATGAFLVATGEGSAAIYYGVGTLGNADQSITAGLGYGRADGHGQGILMVGGEMRLSRRVSLISENWFWGDQPLVSYGFRLIGEKMTVDFAFLNTIGEDAILPGIPYIDFVFSFGR